jgi:hypothetical protein
MTQSFKVELLHGLLEAGQRHTLAELRELVGRDEAMLAELGTGATPAERVSALIANLTLRIGAIATPAMDRILELTAGDRERLLLALCARLLGPEIDLVTTCPSCHGLVEVPIRFDEVISSRPSANEPRIELEGGSEPWSALLRPPTGADVERAARGGATVVRELIVNCIAELTGPSGDRVEPNRLPAEFESDVADALLALDPAAEALVAIACPSCSSPIDALLDAYAILKEGLGGSRRIYDEVYRMARAYHWSEAEILALPLSRRRHYLAIAEGGEVRS